ncbi:MAG: type IV toxin-antitoxin system AbiEi family antitoxin domain-containing protein [Ornithinimicrobium sp.]
MDPTVAGRLAVTGGVASRAELLELGISRQAVDRAITAGELVRTGRGALVCGEVWRQSAQWDRHALRARSAMRVLGGDLALSHHSALSVLGLPVYAVDERVHLVRTDERPGRSSGNWVRHPRVSARWVHEVDGMQVVLAALASLQAADCFGVEAGLVSADAALRAGATREDLQQALSQGRFGRGVAAARTVTQLADPRMESAGESRARWGMRVGGLPVPEPQVTIRGDGGFVARVDFLFREQRTIVEFDGMLKYQGPQDVQAEKRREDQLRQFGYEVVRLTWRDLDSTTRIRCLILAAFERSARLRSVKPSRS